MKHVEENEVKIPTHYSTIYKGLRVLHERNVIVTYPMQFLLRRVFLALGIILLNFTPLLGVMMTFIVPTFYMVCFVVHDNPWIDIEMNWL